MIDVSDGLLADLGHVCEASGVAATVTAAALPLSPAVLAVEAGERDLRARLATAGDDYELLFTAPAGADAAILAVSREAGVPVTAIGAVAAGAGVRLLDADGQAIAVERAGYRHF
jgi:thiamine-monophosphate kinase